VSDRADPEDRRGDPGGKDTSPENKRAVCKDREAGPESHDARPEPMVSRRSLLIALTVLGGGALGVRDRAHGTRLRPPGAASEFPRKCIRCLRCALACPVKAIRFDSTWELIASDTPYIEARERACILCMKCGQVCPTGALTPIASDPAAVRSAVRMGRPELDRSVCVAWNGTGECRACYYVCPYPDRAVRLDEKRYGPVFNPRACVGCGLCEEACPSAAHAVQIIREESREA
jgi:ferredoxin